MPQEFGLLKGEWIYCFLDTFTSSGVTSNSFMKILGILRTDFSQRNLKVKYFCQLSQNVNCLQLPVLFHR